MYAEFSYELVPGTRPVEEVLLQVLDAFALKPGGAERKRCLLLQDSLICEIANLNDFEATNSRLNRLRTDLNGQFNYTFSLRSRNDLIKIKVEHNHELARQIIEA